ncbi:septation ring formation regulator EzrA [Lentibacillus sediminis]|uniref:septation ring formation regulator EzrA n=1 Tax=Lentibacillus sediminis TaxID=1940529 RepID=UPI000C1C092D|nr:septation ring formation regulator EzrA [Lentibacillus sediminis]
MAYFIGIILVIIVLIIVGLILRKRVYDSVDKYEAWKMDIMDRNIASQLSRIKSLNLSGETQQKFEAWKERWETIVTKELPDIEEHLFDAEEAADRYRFPKAKKTLAETDSILRSIEKRIEEMLQEVDDLMDSEKTSRKEIEALEPSIKILRKKISQNRYQFGKSDVHFEAEIDRLEELLAQYHERSQAGDYSQARELVEQLRGELLEQEAQIEKFPDLYKKCKYELPQDLDNLLTGLQEMKEDGYHVGHLNFEKEIHNYQARLETTALSMEKGETAEVEEMIADIEERIKEMYDLLEKEAIAKNYLESKIPSYEASLNELTTTFLTTKEEVEQLRKAYHVEDGDMEKYLSLEKTITALRKQLDELQQYLEEQSASHSEMRGNVEQGFERIAELQKEHDEFRQRIHNLRKDELEAKEKLVEMRHQLYTISKKLKKSNLPGVPGHIWNLMESASDRNERVLRALEKQPLDMVEVQQQLNEAQQAVDQVFEQTDLMLEQAFLTEQVIQYANRYRSQYPLLAGKLAEAERLFRSFEYELALENAAKAVEEVEPGALKRIEENQTLVKS